MINQLYNLKKTQTDQKLMQKAQLLNQFEKIESEILLTTNQINSASVNKYGAISDFMILTIHKNTMKSHIKELEKEKAVLKEQLDILNEEIIELQKETEQFGYLLEEQKKLALAQILKNEQEASEEYIQSKYIS